MAGQAKVLGAALDQAHNGNAYYADTLGAAEAALRDPGLTPSARILNTIEHVHGNSFLEFALARSVQHRRTLLAAPLPAEIADRYLLLAQSTRAEQQQIEAADRVSFEEYRQDYIGQALTGAAAP